jgi:uncharacterized protein with FMN-binding domain
MVHGRSEGAVPHPQGSTGAPRSPWDVDGAEATPWRAVTAAGDRRPTGIARRLRRSPTHWAIPLVAVAAAGLTWALDREQFIGVHRPRDDGESMLAEGGPPTTPTTAPPAVPGSGAALTAGPDPNDTVPTDTTPAAPDAGAGAGTTAAPGASTAAATRAPTVGRAAAPPAPRTSGAAAPTPAPTTAPPPAPAPPPARPAVSGNFVGDLISTLDGPVQVTAVLSNGRLVDVQFTRYPDDTTQRRAYSYLSLPALRDRSLAAQSWKVDTVSQATYTSDAYRRSLQAALQRAGLA